MNDKPTPKTSSWATKSGVQKPEPTPEAPQESGQADGFSTLNAARRQSQLMLNLRYKNGSDLGLAYAYLSAMTFDPSVGILLEMAGYKVTLKGVNLRRLYLRLLMHGVASIREVDPFDDQARADHPKLTAVYSIKAEKV